MRKKNAGAFLFAVFIQLITVYNVIAQETVTPVGPFTKVTVSPHVRVTFIQGDKESVTIENSTVSRDKVHIEVKGKSLNIYLEGAKMVTKKEMMNEDGNQRKKSIYNGTVLTATVTYRTLEDLSIRGEERITLKSKLDQENFDLAIYGTAKVYFDAVKLQKMHTSIYGESYLEIKSGNIDEQKFTAYGESEINTLGITNAVTRLTAYGEAEFKLNVADQLKVTSYGESKIGYKGNAVVNKGLTIGKVKIYKLD